MVTNLLNEMDKKHHRVAHQNFCILINKQTSIVEIRYVQVIKLTDSYVFIKMDNTMSKIIG